MLLLSFSIKTSPDSDIVTTDRSRTQANKKQMERRTEERRIKRQIFLVFSENRFRSGGEENERQMANNVNARDEFMMGTW
jgi:hypothetical protein